jgi:hypothetical protein
LFIKESSSVFNVFISAFLGEKLTFLNSFTLLLDLLLSTKLLLLIFICSKVLLVKFGGNVVSVLIFSKIGSLIGFGTVIFWLSSAVLPKNRFSCFFCSTRNNCFLGILISWVFEISRFSVFSV